MDMKEIQKVTVWNVTATVNKETGKVETAAKNKWCIAVFTKDGGKPLSTFALGMEADKEFKKFLKVDRHSQMVVLAHEFAVEFGLKESEKAVTAELPAAQQIVDNEKAEKEKAEAERKAHPELAAMRQHQKAVKKLEAVAEKSTHEAFKKAVKSISRVSGAITASLEAELEAAEEVADGIQAELKRLAA